MLPTQQEAGSAPPTRLTLQLGTLGFIRVLHRNPASPEPRQHPTPIGATSALALFAQQERRPCAERGARMRGPDLQVSDRRHQRIGAAWLGQANVEVAQQSECSDISRQRNQPGLPQPARQFLP